MDKWEKVRDRILKLFYEVYMDSHTDWAAFCANEKAFGDWTREADFLCEKNLLRRFQCYYQLTAAGRDHVETYLLNQKEISLSSPHARG